MGRESEGVESARSFGTPSEARFDGVWRGVALHLGGERVHLSAGLAQRQKNSQQHQRLQSDGHCRQGNEKV